MKMLAFVLWILGWPMTLEISRFNYYYMTGTVPQDMGSAGALVFLFVWIWIAVLIYKFKETP